MLLNWDVMSERALLHHQKRFLSREIFSEDLLQRRTRIHVDLTAYCNAEFANPVVSLFLNESINTVHMIGPLKV